MRNSLVELVEQLKSQNATVRNRAVNQLGQTVALDPDQRPAILSAVSECLAYINPNIHNAAAAIFYTFASQCPLEALPYLQALVNTRHDTAQLTAIKSLIPVMQDHPQDCLAILFEAYETGNAHVRLAITDNLNIGMIGSNLLNRALEDKDASVSNSACATLITLYKNYPTQHALTFPCLESALAQFIDDKAISSKLIKGLAIYGTSHADLVMQYLLGFIQDNRPEIRCAAIFALSNLQSQHHANVLALLLNHLDDKENSVRQQALLALQSLHGTHPQDVFSLYATILYKGDELSPIALKALERLASEQPDLQANIVDVIKQVLSRNQANLHTPALLTLKACLPRQREKALPLLRSILHGDDIYSFAAQTAALDALKPLIHGCPEETFNLVEYSLQNAKSNLKIHAILLLPYFTRYQRDKVLSHLKTHATDSNANVRRSVAASLGAFDHTCTETTYPLLQSLLQDRTKEVEKAAAQQLDLFARLQPKPTLALIADICQANEPISYPHALNALTQYSEDYLPKVFPFIHQALKKFNHFGTSIQETANKTLLRLVERWPKQMQALIRSMFLTDSYSEVRCAALQAIPTPQKPHFSPSDFYQTRPLTGVTSTTLQMLKKALGDCNSKVRATAKAKLIELSMASPSFAMDMLVLDKQQKLTCQQHSEGKDHEKPSLNML